MGHASTVCTGLCPVCGDVIVTQITTVVFGNVATVTSQLLLPRARRWLHWRTMQTSFTVSATSFIFPVIGESGKITDDD